MKISSYLQGAIATALVESRDWSVLLAQHDGVGGTPLYRCTIVVPGRGTFASTMPGDPVAPLWYVDREQAYRATVACVAESYYQAMVNDRALDRRRIAEDRMPDRRYMQ